MSESVYIGLSSKIALEKKNDIILNNVANSSTIGYKKDVVLFSDHLAKNQSPRKTPHFYSINSFIDYSTARFNVTHHNLDVAINQPRHFFAIQTPKGIRYTRAGNFNIGLNGILVNADGFPVLNNIGTTIAIGNKSPGDISIDQSGTINVTGTGEIGKLGVFFFEHGQPLLKEGNNNFFSIVDESKLGTHYEIMQGFLEDSNINPIVENVELVKTVRESEEMSNIIKNHTNYLKNLSGILKNQ